MDMNVHFGRHRVTSDTVWREPRDKFRPSYRIEQATHNHHRLIDRADHELAYLAFRSELELGLWRDALAQNVLGAVKMDDSTLERGDIDAILNRDPTEATEGPDEQEVLRYAAFLDALTERTPRPPRTPQDILAIHRVLFRGILQDAGQFKEEPSFYVNRRGEVVFVAAMPARVEAELANLLGWLHDAPEHPLVRIEAFFHEFLSIDPFRAGTARVAMALNALLLYGMGYPGVVYAPVDFQLFETSHDYREAFAEAQRPPGDLSPWVRYMAKALAAAFAEAGDRALFRRGLPPDLNPRAVRVAEHLARFHLFFPGESMKLGDIAVSFRDIPRRTLQRDLQTLCETGVLHRRGTKKGASYLLAE